MAVFAVCAVGYTVAAFGLSSAVQFGIGVLILAFASGSGYALFYNLVAQTVTPQRQASTAAAVTVGMNIGGAILPVVIIAILNSTATFAGGVPVYAVGGVQLVFLLPAVLAVLLVGVGAVLTGYQRRHGGRLAQAVDTEATTTSA
jgi:MFS family permease